MKKLPSIKIHQQKYEIYLAFDNLLVQCQIHFTLLKLQNTKQEKTDPEVCYYTIYSHSISVLIANISFH